MLWVMRRLARYRRVLRLEGNGMYGTVPAFLSKLPLTELDLSANSFTGESQSHSRVHSPAG